MAPSNPQGAELSRTGYTGLFTEQTSVPEGEMSLEEGKSKGELGRLHGEGGTYTGKS